MAKEIKVDINKLLYKLHEMAAEKALNGHDELKLENTGATPDKSYVGSGEYYILVSPKNDGDPRAMQRFNSDINATKAVVFEVMKRYVSEFAGQKFAEKLTLDDIQGLYDSPANSISESVRKSPLEEVIFENDFSFDKALVTESLRTGDCVDVLSVAIGVLGPGLTSYMSAADLCCHPDALSTFDVLSVFEKAHPHRLWPSGAALSGEDFRDPTNVAEITNTSCGVDMKLINSTFSFQSAEVSLAMPDPSVVKSSDQVRAMLDDYIAKGRPQDHELLSVSDAGALKLRDACQNAINDMMGNYVACFVLRYDSIVKDEKKRPISRTVKDWFKRTGRSGWKYMGPVLKAGLGITGSVLGAAKEIGGSLFNAIFGSAIEDIKSTTLHTGIGDYNVGQALAPVDATIQAIKRLAPDAAKRAWDATKDVAKAAAGDLNASPRINKDTIGDDMRRVLNADYPNSGVSDVRTYTPQEVKTFLRQKGRYTEEIRVWLDKDGVDRIYYVVGAVVPHDSQDYDIVNRKFIAKIFNKACGKRIGKQVDEDAVVRLKNLKGMYEQRDMYKEKIKKELMKICDVSHRKVDESWRMDLLELLFESSADDFESLTVERMLEWIATQLKKDKDGFIRTAIANAIKSKKTSDSRLKDKHV